MYAAFPIGGCLPSPRCVIGYHSGGGVGCVEKRAKDQPIYRKRECTRDSSFNLRGPEGLLFIQ